jgi:hypothetical protein
VATLTAKSVDSLTIDAIRFDPIASVLLGKRVSMEIVPVVVFAVICLAVVVVADGLTWPQRRGIAVAIFLALFGIMGLWSGVFESRTDGYIMAAFFIPSSAVITYLVRISVRRLTPKEPDNLDGRRCRIGASRLQHLSQIFDVPVDFFFDGAPRLAGSVRKNTQALSMEYVDDFLASAEGKALAKAFCQIKDATVRRSVVHMVEALAQSGSQ